QRDALPALANPTSQEGRGHETAWGRVSPDPSPAPYDPTHTHPAQERPYQPMTSDAILTRFDDLNTWRQGGQRGPHKPLLVLYALGRWQQGKAEVTYKDAEPELTALLREFGRPRKSDHPEQPFWRLQRDGVWSVHAPADLPLKTGDDIPRVTALRSHDVRAGFAASATNGYVPRPSCCHESEA